MSKTVQALLELGSGNAALLYLYRSEHGVPLDPFAVMQFFSWSEATLKTAFTELLGAGLADAADLPPFSSDGAISIVDALREKGSGFAALYEEIQRRLGKVLSVNDFNILNQIYHQLGLPEDVILLLVQHCTDQTAARSGPGRKPTLPQIRREAGRWVELGIDSAPAAEHYVAEQATRRNVYQRLLPRLGIRGRPPIRKEEEYLDRWTTWGFSDDVIALAYERTLFKKQQFDWAYCNGILRNWEKKGLLTLAAVEEFEGRQPQNSRPLDDDISWMRELIHGKE